MKKFKNTLFYLFIFGIVISTFFISCEKDEPEENEPDPNAETGLPSVIIQAPTAEPAFTTIDQNVTMAGIAYDNEGINRVQYEINNGGKTDASGTTDWSVNTVSLIDGDNTIVVFAEDESNNIASDTLIITKNKYLIFIGIPHFNPLAVFKNETTNVTISAQIAPNPNLIASSVELIKVDDNGNELEVVCSLFDDGNLQHGDEILGDNIFSNINSFTLDNTVKLRVKAKTNEVEGEVPGYSSMVNLLALDPIENSAIEEIITTNEEAINKLNELIENNDYESTLEQTAEWLESLDQVESAKIIGGNIDIEYSSGLASAIQISIIEADGNRTQGGGLPGKDDTRKPKIPVNQQTVGLNYLKSTNDELENIILDKDVFIFEPFESKFDPFNKGDAIKAEFNDPNLNMEYNVVHLKNQDCTISSLYNLTDYGFVFLDTHGHNGEWFTTGEMVENEDDYELMIAFGMVSIATNVEYTDNDKFSLFTKYADLYRVSYKYIQSVKGKFPNSIILNSSCNSTSTNHLSSAFFSKEAKTYFGVNKEAHSKFLKNVCVQFVHNIVRDENTTETAYDNISVKTDPLSPNACFEIKGNHHMYYSNSLINGDFELGDLTAWTGEGDRRVITMLGFLTPPQGSYMGIISTGLGNTTSSGQISQGFYVEEGATLLKIKWNFLSEEFMEYVGTQYQDFVSIIIEHDGVEDTKFHKTIDQFAAEFSPTLVSPGIVFDQGDVYQTGWYILPIPISIYADEFIILKVLIGDVGDSSYDSALLMDEILVE